MPHLVKVQEKYKDKGMVLIAQHRQASSLKAKVMSLCASKNVNYTVTQGGMIPGDKSKGIPKSWLFDWNGKKVWEGHPNAIDGALEELMKKAPHWLTRGKELTDKKILGYSRKLFSGKSYGKLIKSLDALATKEVKEGDEKAQTQVDEAKFLSESITQYGKDELGKATAYERTDPIKAKSTLTRLKSVFKGNATGDAATKRLDELKKDKDFQAELKAGKYYYTVMDLVKKMKPGGPMKKGNQKFIAQIAGIARLMNKKYPTSVYTGKVRQLAASYGVKF